MQAVLPSEKEKFFFSEGIFYTISLYFINSFFMFFLSYLIAVFCFSRSYSNYFPYQKSPFCKILPSVLVFQIYFKQCHCLSILRNFIKFFLFSNMILTYWQMYLISTAFLFYTLYNFSFSNFPFGFYNFRFSFFIYLQPFVVSTTSLSL